MKKVSIEWIDSYTIDNWMEKTDAIDQFKKLMPITSVGMLLYDDDNCVVLCHSASIGDDICGLLHIPKVSVIKITELRNK